MNEPRAINVEGTEKYLVSLKIESTTMEKTIPKIIRIKPGIPRNFKGCLIDIISIKDKTTVVECEIGFLVDVFDPVL